jgi:Raf kinase inhibitor-like YbhB/YbcL family protein
MKLQIHSPAFDHECEIPKEYTCQGRNISPELNWNYIPEKTKSFVLIVDDPDAPDPKNPKRTWVHWVVYNIPPNTKKIEKTYLIGTYQKK